MTTNNQSALPLSELQRELLDKLESSKNKKLISDEISSVLSKLCEERLAMGLTTTTVPQRKSGSQKN